LVGTLIYTGENREQRKPCLFVASSTSYEYSHLGHLISTIPPFPPLLLDKPLKTYPDV